MLAVPDSAIVEGMSEFNEGDKVTISRGKNKGEAGTIAARDGDSYAVKLDRGGFVTAAVSSLKGPEQKVLTEAQFREFDQSEDNDDLAVLIRRHFSNETPGVD